MSDSPLKQYTLDELALGDGKEGRPALVGYNGRVYDCTPSKLWKNGKHVNAHFAGQDLTASMPSAPHMDDVMARFPVVGEIAREKSALLREPPRLIALLLARHPHPISVHFPIGLGFVGALLTALTLALLLADSYAQLRLDLRTASWYMLLTGGLFSLPAIATGLLSWWFNYGGKLNWLYRWKLILSGLLLVLAVGCIGLGWPGGQYLSEGGGRFWAYSLLAVAQAPTVILLGWLGGKIVYP